MKQGFFLSLDGWDTSALKDVSREIVCSQSARDLIKTVSRLEPGIYWEKGEGFLLIVVELGMITPQIGWELQAPIDLTDICLGDTVKVVDATLSDGGVIFYVLSKRQNCYSMPDR